jgi:hypothetical protein
MLHYDNQYVHQLDQLIVDLELNLLNKRRTENNSQSFALYFCASLYNFSVIVMLVKERSSRINQKVAKQNKAIATPLT